MTDEQIEQETEDLLADLEHIELTARIESSASVQAVATIDKDFDDAFSKAQDDLAAIKELTAPRRYRRRQP